MIPLWPIRFTSGIDCIMMSGIRPYAIENDIRKKTIVDWNIWLPFSLVLIAHIKRNKKSMFDDNPTNFCIFKG